MKKWIMNPMSRCIPCRHWCAELYFDKRSEHSGGCVDDRNSMYAPLSHPVVQAEHRTEAAKQLRRSNLNHGKAEHLHAIEYKEEMAALGGLSTPSLSCTKSGGWTMNPMSRCPPSHWCAELVWFTLTTSMTPCRR